jgi:SAM-dependent methyltransferase
MSKDTVMLQNGFVGGEVGYKLLRRLGREVARTDDPCGGEAYDGVSKLQALFGEELWDAVQDRNVLDFGCGTGREAIELAQRGARLVVGVDIRQKLLDIAVADARRAGIADRCSFGTQTYGKFDVILSVDGFEHYADPGKVLRQFHSLLLPGGRVYIAFGPPWLHPLGGHLFSVFPWAHLIFTEEALLRWRADFKSDGARRFGEVEGGLNQMTLRRFRRLVAESGFEVESLEPLPIRRFKPLFNPLTQEFLTSVVRCSLLRRVVD